MKWIITDLNKKLFLPYQALETYKIETSENSRQ